MPKRDWKKYEKFDKQKKLQKLTITDEPRYSEIKAGVELYKSIEVVDI